MDPLFLLFMFALFFLAGVGVGTFVLGSRIRKVVAEAVAAIKVEEHAAEDYLVAELNKLHEAAKAIKERL